MKRGFILFLFFLLSNFYCSAQLNVYHPLQKDVNGVLIPWYHPTNHGTAYNHGLDLVWNFWKNIPTVYGYKYYMMDHTYATGGNANKIGGDQFAMVLSSWALYYAYTGDSALIKDMVYIADTYLDHSLSDSTDAWANLPYPCNPTDPTTAVYDGDFLLGAGYTQPDKAGSFGAELINLYKITSNPKYLKAAIKIANTLSAKVQPGDSFTSPYPFKVHAATGALPTVVNAKWHYTGNVVPTMRLFESLSQMGLGNTVQYDTAYQVIKRWVQKFPQMTNEWGSFFEDIPVPSNTETNAVTMATYILEHPNWSSTYKQEARAILDWTLATLGSHAYDSLGVTAIYEQTADLKEGGSHTSRFAAAELLYAELTGNTSHIQQAIRQLDWCTYLVDFDGTCRFTPKSGAVWYTDGYGDYVRHFIHAMASNPYLAPDSSNHLLRSSSVVKSIIYQPKEILYNTYDTSATELLRLTSKPLRVKVDGQEITEVTTLQSNSWRWITYPTGGVVEVNHNGKNVDIIWFPTSIENPNTHSNRFKIFPNPVDNLLTIETDALDFETEIIDLMGSVIASNKNEKKIDLNHLSTGTYFLKIKVNEEIFSKIFVKD
jgi:hypothetical protein